jgi:rSAM/selenodomain-associated transferase 1
MNCAIAIMAKAPVPGHCKTRLVPKLSPEQAAGLGAAFLADMTGNLRAAACAAAIAPYVAYAPAGSEHRFDGLLARGTRLVLADGTAPAPPEVTGFGKCLLQTVHSLLAAGHHGVCVLNADSPTLPTSFLLQAAAWLAAPGDRAVLGPAEDGGYYLLGMKQAHAHLFSAISWSTPRVAAQTRRRAIEAGIELLELPTWYDVDDAAALLRLRADLADPKSAGYNCPRTAGFLAAMAMQQAAE